MTGQGGQDFLSGGVGKDIFDYNAVSESGLAPTKRDVIAGFNAAAQDKIDLSTIDAKPGGADNAFVILSPLNTSTPPYFTAPGQIRVFHAGGNTFVDVNTIGSDNVAELRIQLNGTITLDQADFVL